jgi:hypothetical protein
MLLQLLDKFYDNVVIVKAVLMCLTRVVVVLPKDSGCPSLLFWVAVSFLQVQLKFESLTACVSIRCACQ